MPELAFLLAAMAGAAQPPAPPPAPEPNYYICRVQPPTPGGVLAYEMDVPVDGSPVFHRARWGVSRPSGFYLQVQWDGQVPPVAGRLEDRAWFTVNFNLAQRPRGEARIEIRRLTGERYPSEFAYAGPFARVQHLIGTQTYYASTQGRWGELRAWLEGREGIVFALVHKNGNVIAEERLTAAEVAAGAAAIAAARAEAEAMARDLRRRCAVPEQIVITSAR